MNTVPAAPSTDALTRAVAGFLVLILADAAQLLEFYPELTDLKLTDFKVRVVNVREGTAARVRTIIDSADGDETWSTVGVSTNMIEASWHALVDGVVYGLLRRDLEREERLASEEAAETANA